MSQDVSFVCKDCKVWTYEGGHPDWNAEYFKFTRLHLGHETFIDWHDGVHDAVLFGAMPEYKRIPWECTIFPPEDDE